MTTPRSASSTLYPPAYGRYILQFTPTSEACTSPPPMRIYVTMPPIQGGTLVVFGDSVTDAGTSSFYSMTSLYKGWALDPAASIEDFEP